MLALPYGRVPHPLDLGGRSASVLEPAPLPAPSRTVEDLRVDALDAPLGRLRLGSVAHAGARVTVIVSDATRAARTQFLAVLRACVPEVRWTVSIATGTHGSTSVAALGIEAHDFAGCGAGVKAVVPGLGEATGIRRGGHRSSSCRMRGASPRRCTGPEDRERAYRSSTLTARSSSLPNVASSRSSTRPMVGSGVLPRLAASIHLVSCLPAASVERTLARSLQPPADVLDQVSSILVVPRASQVR